MDVVRFQPFCQTAAEANQRGRLTAYGPGEDEARNPGNAAGDF